MGHRRPISRSGGLSACRWVGRAAEQLPECHSRIRCDAPCRQDQARSSKSDPAWGTLCVGLSPSGEEVGESWSERHGMRRHSWLQHSRASSAGQELAQQGGLSNPRPGGGQLDGVLGCRRIETSVAAELKPSGPKLPRRRRAEAEFMAWPATSRPGQRYRRCTAPAEASPKSKHATHTHTHPHTKRGEADSARQ